MTSRHATLSGKMLDVVKVLVTTTRSLVDLQMFQTDQVCADSVNFCRHPIDITLIEVNSRYLNHYLDPNWWKPKPNHAPFLQKKLGSEFRCVKTKLFKDVYNSSGVVWPKSDPDIKITCRPWITVISNGISPNKKVLNCI